MGEQTPRLTVAPGDNEDECPICFIHRTNAGFLRATCGEGYLKPGCFVVSVQPAAAALVAGGA